MAYRRARSFSQVLTPNWAPRRKWLLRVVLGLTAVAAFPPAPAQDERPSWRASAPERKAPPPEVEQPEFHFEIDRSSLSSPDQFKIRSSRPANAASAAPELGRVATWRERRATGTRSSDSSAPSPPANHEPAEVRPDEQVITASIAPPPTVAEPAMEPSSLVPEDAFRLAPSNPVQPEYPREALLDRTEGWVDVEMSVSPDGQVVDVRIVGAEPRRVFERSALRAAGSWQFEPPAAAGISEIQRGVYRFEFNMDPAAP